MTRKERLEYLEALKDRKRRQCRKDFTEFVEYLFPEFQPSHFHSVYYKVLDHFAKGKIKNLIVTVPPQHGKSTGSTIYLPAFLFGLNPNLKIAISSYNTPLTQRFNRSIQRVMETDEYKKIFPNSIIGSENVVTKTNQPVKNSSEFEVSNSQGKILGKLMSVGRGGGLTSQTVNIWIGDDLYKDYEEGNSPVMRETVWDWYLSQPLSRQPEQKLKVFTRWNEDDTIGRIEQRETVVLINKWEDIGKGLKDHGEDVWFKLNFEAIQTQEPTEIDPREKGEALWPEVRPLSKLEAIRNLDPEQFNCLYQGDPRSAEGLLYKPFRTYTSLPELKKRDAYVDSADTGQDYLCCIVYGIDLRDDYYLIDVYYTQDPMEITEKETADFLVRNGVKKVLIESNNAGRSFGRNVKDHLPSNITVSLFSQRQNKESRIFSNSATTNRILMPKGWHSLFPQFYNEVVGFKKMFKANKVRDGVDALTGIIETKRKKEAFIF